MRWQIIPSAPVSPFYLHRGGEAELGVPLGQKGILQGETMKRGRKPGQR